MLGKTREERQQINAEKRRQRALLRENADGLTALFLILRDPAWCWIIIFSAGMVWCFSSDEPDNPVAFCSLLVMGIFGSILLYETFFGPA